MTAIAFLLFACGPGAEVKSGRELYLAYGCAACHGANADGRGPAAALSQVKPRDLTNLGAYRGPSTVEGISNVIAFGTPGMPGYPDIPKREREAIAEHIRSLAKSPARVAVYDAWVRTPNPAVDVASAYMTLVSTANEPLSVVAVSSPLANIVEMHETKSVDGMMSMSKVSAVRIPANGTTKLAPGGTHLMLVGLRKPLPRQTEFTLRLDDGTTVTTTAVFLDEQ
ncbi:MAG TPA: copper chaperone PCu(A)C [Thermoanaerobaculia bacterium]|nr:copper chaperone PCu(A)C [Thermoanaerobaculia bacterium]